MSTIALHFCSLRTALTSARRVTVIPITDDNRLVTITRDPLGRAPVGCTFPTGTKRHPRVPAATTAGRLLRADLGCRYADLRLVAMLDPDVGQQPHAIYTACVSWPDGYPDQAGCGIHRLRLIAGDDARQLRIHPARVLDLLHGPDLATAARNLPELTCDRHHPDTMTLPPEPVRHG